MRKINVRDFRLATRTTSREINRQIVLNLVREHQPISRADLARRMNIGRGRVTSLVNELLEDGSVLEGDTVDAPRGRKPKMLYVRTGDRLVVAIDVRFSRTYVMLSDFAGTQIALETFKTELDPGRLTEELASRVQRLLATYGDAGRCEGVGLVVPGMVDQKTGRVLNAPQLGWLDVALRDPLAAATGLPVFMENAPIACALAQMWMGQRGGDATSDFAYVSVFDGVGAGVVVNGQIVRGAGHTAGEFGHIPLYPDGPRCLCGARGCLEAHTSNLATLARYFGVELSAPGTRPMLAESGVTVPELITRARTGDAPARSALEDTGRYLGLGLAMIVNALNPARIFVGGEITGAWDLIEPHVRAEIAERALTRTAAQTPIIPDLTTSNPRLRGATALVAAPVFAAPQVA
ncbi:MAG: ROK family transcriptional regulator [Gemmatimonadetes bacterium]|nr:ROK family transcriptional regulator [Gemmatimonadota bacterium]